MGAARKLVVTENVSANGIIEFLDPWFDPGNQTDTEDLLEMTRQQMAAETGILLGRTTFEEMRGFWPLQTDDATGITAHLNEVPKYVLSSTLTDPGWENSTVLSGSLGEEVATLLARGDGVLGVTGSISLVHALLEADLVDQLRLLVYPVLTSQGRNLVPDGLAMQSPVLQECRSFRSGVVRQTYGRG